MRGKKILVIIITLALLLACIIALRLRRDKPVGPSVSETSRLIGGPAFEVQVETPCGPKYWPRRPGSAPRFCDATRAKWALLAQPAPPERSPRYRTDLPWVSSSGNVECHDKPARRLVSRSTIFIFGVRIAGLRISHAHPIGIRKNHWSNSIDNTNPGNEKPYNESKD